jgi:hypothetical protein
MFRVLYATVLTALVALPHDMCFCDLVQATFAEHADSHDDDSAPDEHECSCKLMESMAAPQTETPVDVAQSDFLSISDSPFTAELQLDFAVSLNSTRATHSTALIPCALRI